MTTRKLNSVGPAPERRPVDWAERAISQVRLSSGGLRGLWFVDTRTSATLASHMLFQYETVNLERVLAAMPDIFQAGVSMELLGTGEEEEPLEFSELVLVGDELVAVAFTEPRGRFGIAAILAPDANIALELSELRTMLRHFEGL